MRLIITGAGGQLGREMIGALSQHELQPLRHDELDIADYHAVRRTITEFRPDLLVNTAAYTDVDGCELDRQTAYLTNATGAQNLASATAEVGAALIHVSTDFVFDGAAKRPYAEYDPTNPTNYYGFTKLAGEQAVMSLNRRHYVVRTSWLYSSHGKNFVKTMLDLARSRDRITVVDDEVGTPTYAADLAGAIARLIEVPAYGLYHLANAGECSRYSLASRAISAAGYPTAVDPISSQDFQRQFPRPAERPAYTPLQNLAAAELGIRLRPWQEAVDECVQRLLQS